jgi:hypothetical protein
MIDLILVSVLVVGAIYFLIRKSFSGSSSCSKGGCGCGKKDENKTREI